MVDSHLRNRAGQESPFAAPAEYSIAASLGLDAGELGDEIVALLRRIEKKEDTLLGVQDDINAAAAGLVTAANTITAAATDLADAATNIEAEIAAFKQANPGVDTSALNTAVAALTGPLSQLASAQAAVDALKTPVTAPAAPAAPTAPVAEQAAPAEAPAEVSTIDQPAGGVEVASDPADVAAPVGDIESPF